MSTVEHACRRVQEMRGKFTRRDENMRLVRMVREGRMHEVADVAQYFSDDLPRATAANLVRVAAEDLRNVMGTLPALDCSSGNGVSNNDKKRAVKKNRIGRDVWTESRLETEFLNFADYYNSYGFAVLCVEPDFGRRMPIVRVEDPRGFWYLKDRWGAVVECCRLWQQDLDELCAQFPEAEASLRTSKGYAANGMVEVARYTHKDLGTILFCPTKDNTVLQTIPSIIDGVLPYFVVEQPHLGDYPTGRFDETVWIQYAKVLMASYMFRAAERSINAPVVLPRDMQGYELGVDAHMYTNEWKPGMGPLRLDVPPDVFRFNDRLAEETKESAGYPDARQGRMDASIVTGRGVEALMGSFDTDVKTAQTMFRKALEDATKYGFMLYMKFFPNIMKTICGIDNGQSYRVTFTPSRDIGADYDVQCTYGFLLGNSPAQAVMMLLQFQNGDLLSKKSVQKKLPWDIDVDSENREIHIQRLNDSILSGVAAYAQSLGLLIQQGQSPQMVFDPIVKLIKAREAGKDLSVAALEAFTPPEVENEELLPAEGVESTMPGMPPGMGGPGGGIPAMGPSGLLRGVAPGQAGLPPGGLPTILNTAAALRGDQGRPEMSSTVLRRRATGGP